MPITAAANYFHFAVKEHKAGRLHWDLRLQYSGKALLSFAMGLPPDLDPSHSITIARVGDHSLDYLFMERIIPPGQPGAGPTALWDRGVFRTLNGESLVSQIDDGHIVIEMFGQRLRGGFLLRWTGPAERTWALEKEWDDYADPQGRFSNILTSEKILELSTKTGRPRDLLTLELFPASQSHDSF